MRCVTPDEIDLLESLFDEREPRLLAFVPEEGRFDRLRREARELQVRHADPARRPPLFGVPMGVKDAIHADGLATRAGSRLPPAELRGPEGPCVAALKAAGALILGKTVTTEFTYFAPGPTRNPRRPDHTPGGSSSGSAAAVGAGLSPLALGTQTIGSITRPAAYCGVVGFKASYDRVSRAGSIPLAPSLDHVGFFTPDVAFARVAASVVVVGFQERAAGNKPVLGVPEGPYLENASAVGLAHFREVCRRLADAGYAVRCVDAFADFAEVRERHGVIVAAEAARVHEKWYPRFSELYRDKTAELVRRGQEIAPGDLARALAGRGKLRRELTDLMDDHRLDLWISPSAQGPAPEGLGWTGDPVMNLPWTQSGLPTLGLPSGSDGRGLPLGLQLAGRWYADEALLAWAGGIERALSIKRALSGGAP
jgi:Asp-tRNA(Asn)/Glu-tRNA(Gln) amidotransferase A subunit family amidase